VPALEPWRASNRRSIRCWPSGPEEADPGVGAVRRNAAWAGRVQYTNILKIGRRSFNRSKPGEKSFTVIPIGKKGPATANAEGRIHVLRGEYVNVAFSKVGFLAFARRKFSKAG